MPILRRRTLLTLPILTAAGIPALAACSGRGSSSGGDAAEASASTSASTVSAPMDWQSLTGSIMGHSVTVEVAPLVRMDESTTMLPLRITRAADDVNTGALDLSQLWARYVVSITPPGSLSLVRLIDVASSRLWDTINTFGGDDDLKDLQPGQSVSKGVAFGPVDGDQVIASIPMIGHLKIGVVELADAQSSLGVDLSALLDDAIGSSSFGQGGGGDSRVALDIEMFTRTVDEAASSRTTSATITTILASDVTFEFGKYDLTAQADTQLQTVAAQIASYPTGGELSIVGHTDDVADEAFNQTLSEQRAAAVHKRLGELTDLSAWSVTEEGKGETEPAVQGTDETARAANRRVVITLTPTGGTTTSTASAPPASTAASGDALPEAKGPVGKGPEGVTVKSQDGKQQVTIALEKVTRHGKYLLGVMTVSGSNDSSNADLYSWFINSSAGFGATTREEASQDVYLMKGANGVDLIANGLRYSPCDYVPSGWEAHLTLADLHLDDVLDGTTGICVIWPDVGQDSVTLDRAPAPTGLENPAVDLPWRLTDVPVVDG